MGQILLGQTLFVACCVFYVVWWNISFRPETEVNRVGGIRGVLLAVTAVLGVSGLVLSIIGAAEVGAGHTLPLSMPAIIISAIAAYLALAVVTGLLMHREITAELLLIVVWAALELAVISVATGAAALSPSGFTLLAALITAVTISSLVLYVLYYRMPPWPAFWLASVPLITSGIATAVVAACIAA